MGRVQSALLWPVRSAESAGAHEFGDFFVAEAEEFTEHLEGVLS